MSQTDLHPLYQGLGARFAPYRGATAVADYGDALDWPDCALFDRSFGDLLALVGEDRLRFLHGQTTCEIKGLTAGTGTFGFLTTIKGRVEVEMTVLATGDALWLDLPPATGAAVRARFEKYVLIDRVGFEEPALVPFGLYGAAATSVVETVTVETATGTSLPESPFSHVAASVAGVGVRLVREPDLGGEPAFTLWVPRESAATVFAALREAGATPIGWRAFETRRIEAGRLLFGVDFGGAAGDAFPQETGLDGAVSYTKGCYLGQEIVARIHYRGGVQRQARGLVFDRPVVDEGAPLTLRLEGKEVGTASSLARSTRLGADIGLGIVHQRAEPGATVEAVRGDAIVATARVVALPFALE